MREMRLLPAFAFLLCSMGPSLAAAAAEGAGPTFNACGCYRDEADRCHCQKKSKCGCPGECEPMGCEEKRQKQMDKEAAAEVKRLKEQEQKQADREKRRKAGKRGAEPAPDERATK
jgi:hypothetical protein